MASICSIECLWLLRRSRACFHSKITFLIRKYAHSVVSAHISLQVKHFNTSLWRIKRKPASVNYFAIVVLATNKICGTFPWQVSVFSVLWNIMFQKWLFITILNRTCFIFQPLFPHFFRHIGWPEGQETDIFASSDSLSHLIYRVFRWCILIYLYYCTSG